MSTYEEKLALRKQGKTYQEIADILGCSKQAVANSLSQFNPHLFQYYPPRRCAYPGLRKWLNENKVSVSELVRRCGIVPQPSAVTRYAGYLRGTSDLRKSFIDKVLQITGLTYEEAFGGEGK